jgi:hypothetical protein
LAEDPAVDRDNRVSANHPAARPVPCHELRLAGRGRLGLAPRRQVADQGLVKARDDDLEVDARRDQQVAPARRR